MDTKVNYTIIGLFVLTLTAAIIIAGFWIARQGQHKTYVTYQVDMGQSVSGLTEKSPVKFNGVTVGTVEEMTLDKDNPQIVHIILDIEKGTPITESTTATLEMQGVTGISYVALKALTPNAPPLKAKPGQKYPVIGWTPSVFEQLDAGLRDVANSFRSVSDNMNKLMSPQNQQSIQESLGNIAKFTDVLVANSNQVQHLLQNSAAASDKLPATMQQLQTTLHAVNMAAQKLTEASNQASLTLRQSHAALQGINQQAIPNAMEIMTRLNYILNNLEQISNQMKTNPSILVRGAQSKPLGPGEK